MMVPSGRLYLLLLLGMAIAIALSDIFNVEVGILAALVFDAVILGLMAIDGLQARRNRVEVSRHPLGRLSIGRENPVTLSVKSGNHPVQIQVCDNYPRDFWASKPLLETLLPANTTQEFTYNVSPSQRGEFAWGDIQVRQLSPWGLAWADWKVTQSQKVAVYPDLVGLRSLSIRLTLQNTGTMRQSRRQGIGTEFAELREYRLGDDPRLVDWKATARKLGAIPTASLQVRVLEPEQEQTLIILLDRGRLMTARVKGLKRFDWGLNTTLSLALAGLSRGDKVGVGVFDKEVTTWIPPRYLPFCVTLRDPLVDAIASSPTADVKGAYSRAVALDLLAQRQVAFARLQQKGVLVLDAPADRISEQLVDRYLRLKTRNQL
ncbi:MAG: DUF58 domain-containing protein [Cyanosarcina radialis HA8281-LM2]|nr:DUF58 domain-containing protein [Cyanosarcina radialis HA8281-LM2]